MANGVLHFLNISPPKCAGQTNLGTFDNSHGGTYRDVCEGGIAVRDRLRTDRTALIDSSSFPDIQRPDRGQRALAPPCGLIPTSPGTSVEINCPHCGHTIRIKRIKPGKHRPACPACERAFSLSLASEDAEPEIRGVTDEDAPLGDPAPPEVDATGEWSNRPTMTSPPAASGSASQPTRAAGDQGEKTIADGHDATMAEDSTNFSVAANPTEGVPQVLGGYRIVRELGRGE